MESETDALPCSFNIQHIYGPLTEATKHAIPGGRIDGVLTEYKTFPASALVRVPNNLSWEEASTLPCTGVTAYNALTVPPIKAGDSVLVIGTGGVSM